MEQIKPATQIKTNKDNFWRLYGDTLIQDLESRIARLEYILMLSDKLVSLEIKVDCRNNINGL
jgi:hypothetical protein